MKLSDINQKLTERPGNTGFGSIMKQKVKRQLSPFQKGKQQATVEKEKLIKVASKVKQDFQAWKATAFRSSGGKKTPITMNQFLGWVKKSHPKYAEGIETYARGDKDYAEHFSQAIDKKGKQSSTATDDKVKVRDADPDETGDKSTKVAAPSDEGNLELEQELELEKDDKQDITASKGDDDEPKVDTSASIYEARLRAILEADEEVSADAGSDEDIGTNRAITLKDNQIDTLITMGIEKQIELGGGESIVDEPGEMTAKSSSISSDEGGGDGFLEQYSDELETVLTKVVKGVELDKRDQSNARDMLNSI